MNYISKIHQRFSEYLRNSRVLTNPEEFLGENFEVVLNFWLILDELTEEQLEFVEERYDDFHSEEFLIWDRAANLAFEAANEVVGEHYANDAYWAALNDTKNSFAAGCATMELIAIHKILENHQQPLTFFQMFINYGFPLKKNNMKISKIHQDLSEYLENPRVLTHPKEFLGPNYKEVLNFWLFLDELTEEQLEVVKQRYSENNEGLSFSRISTIDEARKNVVGLEHTIEACAMSKAIVNSWAVWMATYELLCKDLFLEQQQPLTFFPMFIDL